MITATTIFKIQADESRANSQLRGKLNEVFAEISAEAEAMREDTSCLPFDGIDD
jgi:hypothetical protein